jgi:hypothetical protein
MSRFSALVFAARICALIAVLSATVFAQTAALSPTAARWSVLVTAQDLAATGRDAEAVSQLEAHVLKSSAGRALAPDLELARLLVQVAALARNEGDIKTSLRVAERACRIAESSNAAWSPRERAQAAQLGGEVAERLLSQPKRAAALYRLALAADPANAAAASALRRLTAQEGISERKRRERQQLAAGVQPLVTVKK